MAKKRDDESQDITGTPSETGPATRYKDSRSIEDSSIDTLKRIRHFEDAQYTDTQWLKKKNPVRDDIDPFYSWDSPGEPR